MLLLLLEVRRVPTHQSPAPLIEPYSSSPLSVKQNNQVKGVVQSQDSQAFFILLASKNYGIISTGFRKMLACLPKCECLKTIVSFGDISCTPRKEAEDLWLVLLLLGRIRTIGKIFFRHDNI
ncbi:uncharacterized protein LOC141619946 [Silene latifolia]|uniref:uncharacterized protein LOC141619946 n=1 Tax=Silene latifolia TaxID=37657 RepID=UPI003D77C099